MNRTNLHNALNLYYKENNQNLKKKKNKTKWIKNYSPKISNRKFQDLNLSYKTFEKNNRRVPEKLMKNQNSIIHKLKYLDGIKKDKYSIKMN